jgi:hypothetical protein
MSGFSVATPLGRRLLADAVSSGGFALALLAASGLLGIPEGLLRGAGFSLLPLAVAVLWLARRPAPPPWALMAVIVDSLAWMAASLLLLASGWVGPTGFGTLLVIAQAMLVAGFAAAQAKTLRRHAQTMAQPARR